MLICLKLGVCHCDSECDPVIQLEATKTDGEKVTLTQHSEMGTAVTHSYIYSYKELKPL